MSVRWRATGELVCGAKSGPRDGDTYIDDRLHYQLAAVEEVLIPDGDEEETGLWHWRRRDPALDAPGPETFALSHPSRPRDVAAWCEPLEGRGRGYFRCLNGAWSGWWDAEHGVVVLDCADPGWPAEAIEVWRGAVPAGHRRDYNEAIAWIKDQICRS